MACSICNFEKMAFVNLISGVELIHLLGKSSAWVAMKITILQFLKKVQMIDKFDVA